jgi:hypothetical protein
MMQKIIFSLSLLVACGIWGCSEKQTLNIVNKPKEMEEVTVTTSIKSKGWDNQFKYRIVVIDKCEYIELSSYSHSFLHKANCTNQFHLTNHVAIVR